MAQKYSAIYAEARQLPAGVFATMKKPNLPLYLAQGHPRSVSVESIFSQRVKWWPPLPHSHGERNQNKSRTLRPTYAHSRPGRTQTTPSMGPRKRRRNTKGYSPDSRAKSHKSQQRCSVMVHKRQSLYLFAALRWTTVNKNPADPAQNVPRTSSYRPLHGRRNMLVRDLLSTCNSSRHEIGPNIHVVHTHKGSRSPTLGASIVDGTTCAFDGFLTEEQGPDKRQPPSGVCSRGI